MNWKPIAGDREHFHAAVESQWSKIADASQEQAEKQVASWVKRAAPTASAP